MPDPVSDHPQNSSKGVLHEVRVVGFDFRSARLESVLPVHKYERGTSTPPLYLK